MATKLPLTLTCGDSAEITRPLAEGLVEPDGIALTVLTNSASRDRHWRLARNAECDLGGVQRLRYFMSRATAAIPTSRCRSIRIAAFATASCSITPAGITQASDLREKRRIAATAASSQARPASGCAACSRNSPDLPHRDAVWVVPKLDEIPFTPPLGLTIETVPPGKSLDEMLAQGEIDAMLAPSFPAPFVRGDKRVARLFPDYKALEIDYYRQLRFSPIAAPGDDPAKHHRGAPPGFRPTWPMRSTRPNRWPVNGCAIRASCRKPGT